MSSINELRSIQHAIYGMLGLESLGIPISALVMAGGAVRDSALGVKPKDFDIYILNRGWDEVATFDKATSISERSSMWGMSSAVFQAYGQADSEDKTNRDFDDNILTGIQLNDPAGGYFDTGGSVYDILFSRHSTIEGVLDSFDCNWNQQYVSACPEHSAFMWEGKRELEFTGKPLREYREQYIRDKYKESYL